MLKPPSPQSAMTWRERSSAWMPLAWPKRGPTGPVVEGADDPLLAALADPVARPERVEPGVEDEHGVARSEVAHHTRHSLRMNAVLTAREIGLLVQLLVPALAFGR